MKTFASIIPVFGLVAMASAKNAHVAQAYPNVTYPVGGYGSASGPEVTHTDYSVVDTLTTYCSEPTMLTYGTKTYTVTKPTTLTITGKQLAQCVLMIYLTCIKIALAPSRHLHLPPSANQPRLMPLFHLDQSHRSHPSSLSTRRTQPLSITRRLLLP